MPFRDRVRGLGSTLALVVAGLIIVSGITLSFAWVSIPAFVVAIALVVLLLWAFEFGVWGAFLAAAAAGVLLFVVMYSFPQWQKGVASVCFSDTCGPTLFASNTTPPPATTTKPVVPATANAGQAVDASNLSPLFTAQEKEIQSLNGQVTTLTARNADLSTKLEQAQKDLDTLKGRAYIDPASVQRIQEQLDQVRKDLANKPGPPVTLATPPAGVTPPEDLNQRLAYLQQEIDTVAGLANQTSDQVTKLKQAQASTPAANVDVAAIVAQVKTGFEADFARHMEVYSRTLEARYAQLAMQCGSDSTHWPTPSEITKITDSDFQAIVEAICNRSHVAGVAPKPAPVQTAGNDTTVPGFLPATGDDFVIAGFVPAGSTIPGFVPVQ